MTNISFTLYRASNVVNFYFLISFFFFFWVSAWHFYQRKTPFFQIRVHLQFLGHPIANDMLYLSECVPNRCIEGMSTDRAAANSALYPKSNHCEEIHVPHSTDEPFDDFKIDRMCTNCPNLAPKGWDFHILGIISILVPTSIKPSTFGTAGHIDFGSSCLPFNHVCFIPSNIRQCWYLLLYIFIVNLGIPCFTF